MPLADIEARRAANRQQYAEERARRQPSTVPADKRDLWREPPEVRGCLDPWREWDWIYEVRYRE